MFHRLLVAFVLTIVSVASAARAVEGVSGTTVRPTSEEAKVKGCHIARPDEYEINVGDLVDLEYSYPVVPTTIPQKVSVTSTLTGAVTASPLGIRTLRTPPLVGMTTIAFYFDAKAAGEETISLSIDDQQYTYKFKVAGKK
jgi:hypothetical protein